MSGRGEMLQMRLHFGERDRAGDGTLDAAVLAACERVGVRAAALLRGAEGFGAKQRLRTDRLLSLSEDTPLVAVAVGEVAVIEALAEEVGGIAGGGLSVVERVEEWQSPDADMTATAITSAASAAVPVISAAGSWDAQDVVKATIWGPRTGSASPHLGAVDALRRHGAEAATVLLGVDGVLDRERRRSRFFAANRGVPALTVAVGERARVGAALAEVEGAANLVTVESVEPCSRHAGAGLQSVAGVEGNSVIDRGRLHGEAARVTLVSSETASRGAHPAYLELIHALRREGAPGATALRGVWGFRGRGEPHGDRVLALRRDVPIVVETVDARDGAARGHTLARSIACEGDLVYAQQVDGALTLE